MRDFNRETMSETPTIRINKFLADCGVCSRRKAETLIRDLMVTVNGKTAEIGQKIDPDKDKVVVEGRRVRPNKRDRKVVLMMNKPKGVLSSNADPFHAQTVFDLLPKEFQDMRLFCAGRLDKDSEGLLILTNDGEIANQITHPSAGVTKIYHVKLNRAFDPLKIPKLIRGVTREGERLYAKKIIPATKGVDSDHRLEVHLEQGRKREIRRLFEAFGYFVKKLHRSQIGRLQLKKIPPGGFRELKTREIESLFKS